MRLVNAEDILKQLYEDAAVLNVPLSALKFTGEDLKEMLLDEKQTPTVDAIPRDFIEGELPWAYETCDQDLAKDITYLLYDWDHSKNAYGQENTINDDTEELLD